MLEYYLSAIIILACIFLFKYVIKPKRQFENYVRQFQSKGFKVYKIPFKAMALPVIEKMITDEKQSGDAKRSLKEVYPNYDVVISNSMSKVLINCLNLQLLKEFFSANNPERYPKVEMFIAPIKRALGEGVVFSEGGLWKKKRKILNRVFTFDFLKGLTDSIALICDEEINQILRKSKKETKDIKQQKFEFDLLDLTTKIFSSVVMQGFLGVGIKNQRVQNVEVATFITQLLNSISYQYMETLSALLGPRYLKLGLWASHRDINNRLTIYNNWCKDFVDKKISQCESRINSDSNKMQKPKDLIEAIILDKKQNKDDAQLYGKQEIVDEFNTFFIAGTDTTANFLASIIYSIVKNPHVEQKIREEIEKFMKNDDFSYENLKNFQYIEWTLKEAIRLCNPSPQIFIREVSVDHLLCGVKMRKGTQITATHLVHCFSEKYFPDPLSFRPERWQNQCQNLPPFVFSGFSFGPRVCIGKNLVHLESKIALIKIFKKFSRFTLEKENYKIQQKFVYAPESMKIQAWI